MALDLNGSAAGVNHTVSATEQIAVSLTNPLASVAGGNGTSAISRIEVEITGGFVSSEDLLTVSSAFPSSLFNVVYSGGILTITAKAGKPKDAEWTSALTSIEYLNQSDTPTDTARTVTFRVYDSSKQPALVDVATSTVTAITPVNDAPVLELNTGGPLSVSEQVTTTIAPTLDVTDPDSTTLASVTVQITDGYQNGEDVLGFADTSKIVGLWDAATGTLTLTAVEGQSPIGLDFEAAMRSITYTNTSDKPNPAARTLTITVTDPNGTSNWDQDAATRTVTLTVGNVNDAPTGTVVISGEATQGETLTAFSTLADADGAAALSLSYQWLRDGVAIPDATASTYVLAEADVGTAISVQASYTDAFGQPEAVTSGPTSAVANVNDAPTGVATATLAAGTEDIAYTLSVSELISGFADPDGDTLSVASLLSNGGSWTNDNAIWTFTPDANFSGTVTLSYNVVDGQGGSLAATQTFSLAAVDDAPTGSVTVSGEIKPGATLAASNTLADTDGPDPLSISYQWLRDGAPIGGAVGSTYLLTQTDIGKTISVQAGYTDAGGHAESVLSAATSPVKAIITVAVYRAATGPFPTGTTLADHSSALASLTPGELGALETSGIGLVDATDGVLALSTAQIRGLSNVALDPADRVTLLDAGAAVSTMTAAELAGLAGRGIDAVDASNDALTLTLAQFTGLGPATWTASDTITIADAGSTLRGLSGADLRDLAAKGVDGLDATNNVLTLSVAQYKALGTISISATDILTVNGSSGRDAIVGRSSKDVLMGFAGGDSMKGGYGNDVLEGGAGRDVMSGGLGNDRFVFRKITESGVTSATHDVITDFRRGDKIDLGRIDADTTSRGNQAFKFVSDFSGEAGQLQWDKIKGGYLISADVNGDGRSDFAMRVNGSFDLRASDFVL